MLMTAHRVARHLERRTVDLPVSDRQ
jgi:hypothetical protein